MSSTTPLDQRRIVALGHHPDQRLGARLADDQAAAALELGFGGGDALAHAVGLERLGAAVEADVLEQLRQRLELAQQLARRRFGLDQRGKHLQPGDQPVAGRRMIGEDDVARLLAADVAAALAHLLEHIAVADLGAEQLEALLRRASARGRGWT